MSDLTRRVLNEFHDWWKVHREDSIDALSDPGRDLIHAAPVLARQVEAVEEVLAYAEEPIAFRIRRALAEAEKGDTP